MSKTTQDERKDRKDIRTGYSMFFRNGMIIRPPWRINRYIQVGRTARGF